MNMKRIGFQAHNMWWQPIRSPEYSYDKQDSLSSTTTPHSKKKKEKYTSYLHALTISMILTHLKQLQQNIYIRKLTTLKTSVNINIEQKTWQNRILGCSTQTYQPQNCTQTGT